MKKIFGICIYICGLSNAFATGWFEGLIPSFNRTQLGEATSNMQQPLSKETESMEHALGQSISNWSQLNLENRTAKESLNEIVKNKQSCIDLANSLLSPSNKAYFNEVEVELFLDRINFACDAVEALRRREAQESPQPDDELILSHYARIHSGRLGVIRLD